MANANGIMDAGELIDSIIHDLNESVRYIFDGKHIAWCGIMANTVQRLTVLKDGIAKDIASKNRTIEDLKTALRAAGSPVETVTPEEYIAEMQKGGANDGSN
jgi:hypothetical protein